MNRPAFVGDEIYHVYNRGVEKRNIFLDDDDYFRFIHYLFHLNDKNSQGNLDREIMREIGTPSSKKEREPLVEILAFALMPNHFHLILKQKEDGGIVKFMQKIGVGYAMSFNKKNKRVGPLFQGRFKAVLVEKDAHFMYLPHYIHLNPLDLLNKGVPISLIEKMKFLKEYRWSSFPDYIGIKNFPSVTRRDFLLNFFGGEEKYKKDLEKFIAKDDISGMREIGTPSFELEK